MGEPMSEFAMLLMNGFENNNYKKGNKMANEYKAQVDFTKEGGLAEQLDFIKIIKHKEA